MLHLVVLGADEFRRIRLAVEHREKDPGVDVVEVEDPVAEEAQALQVLEDPAERTEGGETVCVSDIKVVFRVSLRASSSKAGVALLFFCRFSTTLRW